MTISSRIGGALALLALAALLAGGCKKEPDKKDDTAAGTEKSGTQAKKDGGHGWWCDDHGIPEDECSMCSAEMEKKFKAAKDWCEKHPDRARSQCFICNPKQREVYAAKYRAKYGKEPPPDQQGKEDKKE